MDLITRRQAVGTLANGTAVLLSASCQRSAPLPIEPGDKPMNPRPRAVAFGVVEAVFSLEPLRPHLPTLGLAGELVGEWYTRLIRDALALDATGVYRPFRDVARSALTMLAAEHGRKLTDAQVDGVLAGFAELPAFPDA